MKHCKVIWIKSVQFRLIEKLKDPKMVAILRLICKVKDHRKHLSNSPNFNYDGKCSSGDVYFDETKRNISIRVLEHENVESI